MLGEDAGMTSKAKKLLIVAAALVVAGVLAFALQPGEPEAVCVQEGTPSSGFVDEDQGGCPISIESYEEIADYRSAPKPFRIAGLLLLVAGVGAGVAALVIGRRGGASSPNAP